MLTSLFRDYKGTMESFECALVFVLAPFRFEGLFKGVQGNVLARLPSGPFSLKTALGD